MYYSIFKYGYGGGIQVTGSHNPPDMNGFKLCLGTHTLSGEEIQDLKARCERAHKPAQSLGKIEKVNILPTYISELIGNVKPYLGKRKLKVVVDAGNGVGGLTGVEILRGLGCEVVELFCEPDGNFPNHHPDPTVLKNLTALIDKVKKETADFGIGWDGDADRIGVVDNNGEPIYGDMLLLLYAREILKEKPGSTIVGDVKCSFKLYQDIEKHGGKPIMWKTGHSLIKAKLKETGGELGGEMSGHIFFKNRFYGFDDAVYASARFIELMSNTSKKASELLEDLPKTVSTPEIRVDCPEEIKFKIAEKAKESFPEYTVNTIDGVRIEFPFGWGLVRASNTQPVLVMRFEATSDELLKEYESLVVSRIEEIKSNL
jgi:phosphomannomutase/phosphoglucomutase